MVAMAPVRSRFKILKTNLFKWLLVTVPIAHTYTDSYEARKAMGHLLYYHSSMAGELCSCFVCTILTTAYNCAAPQWYHHWRFCSNQFECTLCYNLVGEMMHILLPEHWPIWAKNGVGSPLHEIGGA